MRSRWGLVAVLAALVVGGWFVARQMPRYALISPDILVDGGVDMNDDGWFTYNITIPKGDVPLTCYFELIVDGVNKRGPGIMAFYGNGKPRRFQYRVSNEFDSRTKEILKTQGLPVKEGIVLYNIDFRGLLGYGHKSEVLRFATKPGWGSSVGMSSRKNYKLGEPIILSDHDIYDNSLNQLPPEIDRSLSSQGKAHHLICQLRISKDTRTRKGPTFPLP